MNIRQINLALAVAMIDSAKESSPLVKAKKVLKQFQNEIGRFRGLIIEAGEHLSPVFESQRAQMNFDHCTISIELITNRRNQQQYISGIKLRENFPTG